MESILQTLLEITIYSAVIFAGILLLKGICGKKMSPVLHYALWLVLLLRLVIPTTIDSGFSIFTLPEHAAPIVADAAAGGETVWDSPILQPQDQVGNGMALADEAANPPSAPTAPQEMQKASTRLTWAQILTGLWLVGMVGCLVWLGVLYMALRRRIRKNAALPSKKLLMLLEEVKGELGVKSNIRLLCLYEYGTPALLFPNTILMPVDALAVMNAEQVKLALRHELTHFKRGDQFMNLLLSLLNAIYWFNPVVWIAFRLMRSDMETACDSMVTRRLNRTEKNDYANLILSLFSQPEHRQIVLGMAEASTRKVAEQRIRGIFMRKSSKPVVKVVSIVTVLLLTVGCFTTACVPKTRKDSATSANDASEHGTTALSGASAHLSFERTLFDGLLTLKVDADAALPHASPYRTYRMVDVPFTQEQVDTMVRVLLHREPTYSVEGSKITKEEALVLLNEAKDLLSRLEAGEALDGDDGPYTIEGMREAVAAYQEMYDMAAPEQRTDAAAEQYAKQGSLRLFADLGQERRAELEIPRYEADGMTNQMSFSNGMEYCLDDNGDDQLPQGVAITRDEAVALAKALVADLGADYMELAFVGRRSRGDGSEYDIQSDEYRNTQCHMMIFTRTVDGIPTIADNHASIRLGPSGTKSMDGFFERIYVAVDDSGIRHVVWRGHKELREVVSEDLMLLDPAQLTECIVSAVEQEYVSLTNQNASLRWQSADVTINRVALNYVAHATAEGDYLLKPVWDCFGISDMRLYPDEVAAYQAEYDVEIPVVHYNDDPSETICTIDAESGAPYDKYRGVFGDA